MNSNISPADKALRDHHRQIDFFERIQKSQKKTHTRQMEAERHRLNRLETVRRIS